MPPRFVEVIDLQSEANTIVSSIASKATGAALNLKLNISDYINATAGVFDARLVSMLESYNMSRDDIFDAMSLLNLNMTNSTLSIIEKPKPIPSYLMAIGSAFIFAHLIIVHVYSRKLVQRFGNHH